MEAVGGPDAALYGELTPLGFRKLAARIKLVANDSFVDCGSGLGRLCFQAVSEFSCRAACGVEFAASRHELAVEAAAQLPEAISSCVKLVEGDCSDAALWAADGPLDGTTVVYLGSLMFSAELMDALARRIETCPAPLRAICTLKQWIDGNGPRNFREATPPERCESTWTAPQALADREREPGSPVFVYLRSS